MNLDYRFEEFKIHDYVEGKQDPQTKNYKAELIAISYIKYLNCKVIQF